MKNYADELSDASICFHSKIDATDANDKIGTTVIMGLKPPSSIVILCVGKWAITT